MSSVLSDALEQNRRDERRRALRALLMRPLLRVDDLAYAPVRRHAAWLRDWLEKETGWLLRVESDHARLLKRPADRHDDTRPARDVHSGMAFNRRRYCLLCLALAVLERGDSQTTLGRLGDGVLREATAPELTAAGLHFALDSRDERRDLVAVARLLLELGVLRRVAGDEDSYLNPSDQNGGDALYDCDRRLLASLLACPQGPSLLAHSGVSAVMAERIAAISRTFEPDTPDARNRLLRQQLTRRLLDDPVVYWHELSEAERDYLRSQRSALCRRIEEATGLIAEVRAEGLALVDPDAELTDWPFPAEGTDGHATLLLATYLAAQARAGRLRIDHAELHTQMQHWSAVYGSYWRKAVCEPGGTETLYRAAVAHLYALRLVEQDTDGVYPLPAVHRYALAEKELPTHAES